MHGRGRLAAGVAGVGEGAVGEGEDHAPVAGAVRVEVVRRHLERQPRRALGHLAERHAEPARRRVAAPHRGGGPLRRVAGRRGARGGGRRRQADARQHAVQRGPVGGGHVAEQRLVPRAGEGGDPVGHGPAPVREAPAEPLAVGRVAAPRREAPPLQAAQGPARGHAVEPHPLGHVLARPPRRGRQRQDAAPFRQRHARRAAELAPERPREVARRGRQAEGDRLGELGRGAAVLGAAGRLLLRGAHRAGAGARARTRSRAAPAMRASSGR